MASFYVTPEFRTSKVTDAKAHFSRVNFDFNTIWILNRNIGSVEEQLRETASESNWANVLKYHFVNDVPTKLYNVTLFVVLYPTSETYLELCQTYKIWLLGVNCLRKTLHLRCLKDFECWYIACYFVTSSTLDISNANISNVDIFHLKFKTLKLWKLHLKFLLFDIFPSELDISNVDISHITLSA